MFCFRARLCATVLLGGLPQSGMTPEHENHVLQHRHLSKAGLRALRVLVDSTA